ncbi:SDR family NAD(P)-dependent oxidoreductase [Nocardia sp. NBC_01499]|uniref:SDR family NAD(P)-dependent oxidoreductase n=1 Tax=Nocardia sp. NBC_01499 TaxID=2903597 RepID=UPI0038670CE5
MAYFANRVAAITGAGSGIGREPALALARDGALLALSDKSPEVVAETGRLCAAVGLEPTVTTLDVTDRVAALDHAAATVAQYGRSMRCSIMPGSCTSAGWRSRRSAISSGLTDSLRQDMRAAGGKVRVTGVYSGGVLTTIARSASVASGIDAVAVARRFEGHVARTSPDVAARTILRGEAKVLVGLDALVVDLVTRFTGSCHERVLDMVFRS